MRAVIIWSEDITPTVLSYAFQKAGWNITIDWLDSIETGFNSCIESPPDLLIVKRSLYRRDDGLDLCQRLHGVENLPKFPIVVGYIDVDENWEAASQQVYQAGATLCFGRVSDVGKVARQIAKLFNNSINPSRA